jgi:hypothetical protein
MYLASVYSQNEALYSIVAGSFTAIAFITTTDFVLGDVIRIEAEGSTIRYKKNGVEQTGSPVTNTAIASGRWGIFMYQINPRLNNWQGGDFTVFAPTQQAIFSQAIHRAAFY